MTTIDFDALQASEGPKVTLLGNQDVGGGLIGAGFEDFSVFAFVAVEVKTQRRSSRVPSASLSVLVEHSDDGLSWVTAKTFTFADDGVQSASIASPKAHLRGSASGVGGDWYLKSLQVSPRYLDAVGGGGGSLPDQWTVAADGGLKIQPDSASGHPLDIESVPGIGGAHITAESTGKVRLNSQSPTATPAAILLDNGGSVPLTLQADGFIGLGPTANVGVSEGGYLGIEGLGEVPADSEIGPGGESAAGAYAVIYFDYTHGSAKLMCKARDIDGTIVTGVICNLT